MTPALAPWASAFERALVRREGGGGGGSGSGAGELGGDRCEKGCIFEA